MKWKVFHLLLFLCQIAPGAIGRSGKKVITFQVKDGPLLWSIADYIRNHIRQKSATCRSAWPARIEDRKGYKKKEQQVFAENRLWSRHLSGHYYSGIVIPPGGGKTRALLYFISKMGKELAPYIFFNRTIQWIKRRHIAISRFRINCACIESL